MFPQEKEYYAKTILALFFGYFSFAMFRLSLGVVIPNIIQEININEFQAGILYSIPLWSTVVLLTPAGWMADRLGRKKVLMLGYLILAIGTLSFSCSPNYFLLITFLMVSGLGSGLIVPSYYSLMGETLRKMRGVAVGLALTSYHIGGLAGSYFVGIFAALRRWRAAFAIIGIIQFFMLLIQIITVRTTIKKKEEAYLPFFSMLEIRNILISSISIFLGSISFFAANAWLTSLLIFRGCGQAEAGLILGLYFISGAISSPIFGGLSERTGRKKTTFYLSAIAAVVATITFLLIEQLFISIICVIVLGAFIAPYWSLLTAVVQESVPEKNVSSATGVTQALGVLGCAVGPIISGALIPVLGIEYALFFSVTLPSILCGLIALFE